MPRHARRQSATDTYHLIARGNSKQLIFEDEQDRHRFLKLLENQASSDRMEIYAYCLMDNHVHILAKATMQHLSSSIRNVLSSYAFWFNVKYKRNGHLFQERFRSEAVEDEKYFLTVLRYIHNNPSKAGLHQHARVRWSSYQEYLTTPRIVSTSLALNLLGGKNAFEKFHNEETASDDVMDIEDSRRIISDTDASVLAKNLLDPLALDGLKSLDRERRDNALYILKDNGLGVRQIQRLTGISLGVISKA